MKKDIIEFTELQQIASEIIEKDPRAIRVIKRGLINGESWEDAIAEDPSLYRYCINPTYNAAMLAVSDNGANLFLTPKHLWDEKLIDQAIISSPDIIMALDDEYVTQRRKELAVSHNIELIGVVENLSIDYIREQIKLHPACIRYIPNPSESLKCLAIEVDPNTALYFDHLTKRMEKVLREKYPGFIDAIGDADY